MYFSALFEDEEYVYAIEKFSQKLISINKKSKRIEILMQLPWECEYYDKNGIWQIGDWLYVYSTRNDYFVRYDTERKKKEQILRFEHLECDNEGVYYSNLLVYNDHIVLLPFMGTEIKIYNYFGKFQESISLADIGIWKRNTVDRNIRGCGAAIVGDMLYFSFRCEKENYLCRYDLKQRQMSVAYHSGEVPILGVYHFEENIVLRRMFPRKTEFVFLTLDGKVENRVTVDEASGFEADIYAENGNLVTFVYNKLITIDRTVYEVKKQLKRNQVYIEKGALFDEKEAVFSVIRSGEEKYEFGMIADEIRKTKTYIEGKQKLLIGRDVLLEGIDGASSIYKLLNDYLYGISDLYEKEKKDTMGNYIWEGLSRKEGL